MTLREHFWKELREVSMACGFIVVAVTVGMQLSGMGNITLRNLWQIVLIGSTLVFRFESFINFHDLPDHSMRWNYIISSVLADVTLVALVYGYTGARQIFIGKEWIMLAVYVVFRTLLYVRHYRETYRNAKQINDRLKNNTTK